MFYTKLVIQNSDSLITAYLAILNKRWDLVSATPSGGTKAYRLESAGEWVLRANIDAYNSAESKAIVESIGTNVEVFPEGIEYYEGIRVWDSAAIAQQFVAAVQALNLPGVTISYEGATDPTVV